MAEPAARTQWNLVTGAGGFVGRHLVRRLALDPTAPVLAIGGSGTTAAEPGTATTGVTYLPRRVQELGLETWRELGIESFDTVFHLAAFTPKRPDEDDPVRIHESNIEACRRLYENLPRTRRLVFASTLDVYGSPPAGAAITERTPPAPQSLYAASKLYGESLAQWYGRRCGWEVVVLRYGHLFGPGEDAYEKLIPATLRSLLRGRPPVIFGDGCEQRDLLYVADAVEATVRAASAPAAAGEIVNVVRGESVEVREIINELVAITGFLGPVRHRPRDGDGDGVSLRFDAARMRELLGRWTLTTLAEGLRAEVADAAPRLLAAVQA
jgi:nucleoside-diphosphate-sugar epimerase